MSRDELIRTPITPRVMVADNYTHIGRITSVNYKYGIIHFEDIQTGQDFGRHYTELKFYNHGR